MILVPSGYGLTPRRDHPRCRWRISTLRHFALDEQRFALHIEAVSGYTGGSTTAQEGETAGGLPQKETKMSIEQFIDNEVKSNDVVLFMKGTPQFPQCGFSGQVVQILDHVGV